MQEKISRPEVLPQKLLNLKFILLGVIFAVVALATFSPKQMLWRGQLIKQQEAYSIAKSLEKSFIPIRSFLPCESPLYPNGEFPWVNEPPLYHTLDAFILKFVTPWTKLTGLLLTLLYSLVFYFLALDLFKKRNEQITFFLLASFTPILLRYLPQQLPDVFSSLLLTLGVLLLLKGRTKFAAFIFILSSLSKVLTGIPISFILLVHLLWDPNTKSLKLTSLKNYKKLVSTASVGLFLFVPFIIWVSYLNSHAIPNPFNFSSLTENRHSGAFSLLLSEKFLSRTFKWTLGVGIGYPLALGIIYLVIQKFRSRTPWFSNPSYTDFNWIFIAWAGSLLPYIVATRLGWFTHDYYFLPFFPAFVYWGTRGILCVPKKPIQLLLITASLIIGILEPLRLKEFGSPQDGFSALCKAEVEKYLERVEP